MKRARHDAGRRAAVLLTALLVAGFLFPVYLTFVNGMKTYREVAASTVAWPQAVQWSNYATVWRQLGFFGVFVNSAAVTAASVAGILLIGSLAAYAIVRFPGKASTALFMTMLSSLVIPFQTMMVPLVKVAKELHFINTLHGLVVMYWGFGIPLALFVYHGFMKTVPRELEESAHMDGCGQAGAFFRIMAPLMRPVTATIAILQTLWIWNDFLLPLVTLSSRKNITIPLASAVYFGQYTNEWHLAMAALTMAIAPVLLFFVAMQRHIMAGIAAGAVKG